MPDTTDREILEMAAKAAELGDGWVWWDLMQCLTRRNEACTQVEQWGPLHSNGDAFWLVVRLMLDVCISPCNNNVCVWCEPISAFVEEPLMPDAYAATRRAIVRAAAAIGASMP